jgi:hypothetical protein
VKGYEIGTTIKLKSGFKVWGSATTGAVNGGMMSEWISYTIMDSVNSGALALTVSLTASAVLSLLL